MSLVRLAMPDDGALGVAFEKFVFKRRDRIERRAVWRSREFQFCRRNGRGKAKNERKQAEIELSESNTSVRTEAVKLNLISSNGASKIILTAPESAQLVMSTAAQAAENADLEGRLTSYAGD